MEAVVVLERVQSMESIGSVMEKSAAKRKRVESEDEEVKACNTVKVEVRELGEEFQSLINMEKDKKRVTLVTISGLMDINRKYEDIVDRLSEKVERTEGRLDEAREQLVEFRKCMLESKQVARRCTSKGRSRDHLEPPSVRVVMSGGTLPPSLVVAGWVYETVTLELFAGGTSRVALIGGGSTKPVT